MPSLNDWAKEKVLTAQEESLKVQASYKTEIKGLGGMILQNGLYGAIAYHKVRNKDSSHLILSQLNELMFKTMEIQGVENMEPIGDLEYMKAQSIALEAIKWLRRYADILIEEDIEKGDRNG